MLKLCTAFNAVALDSFLRLTLLQVGPLPIGAGATYVQQYDDGHIPWVKRPGDDLGDTGAMVIPMPVPEPCPAELHAAFVYCAACTVSHDHCMLSVVFLVDWLAHVRGKHGGVKGVGGDGDGRQCGGVWGALSSCRSPV